MLIYKISISTSMRAHDAINNHELIKLFSIDICTYGTYKISLVANDEFSEKEKIVANMLGISIWSDMLPT